MATLGIDRLNGWKAIAAYLRVDVRTARRWEAERALPVHRLPGDSRSPVWADPAELAAWLARPPAPDPAKADGPADGPTPAPADPPGGPAAPRTPAAPAPHRRGKALLLPALLGLSLLLLIGFAMLRPGTRSNAPAAPYPDAPATRLLAAADYAKASRTPAGLEEAATLYTRLATAHPDNPAAFVGLADTWLLMREFSGLPDEAAFRRARDAAEAALKRDPGNPAALRALAFTLFWSGADRVRGLALFEESARAAPRDPRTHHWQGNALAFAGNPAAGLEALARARALNPESPAIAADEAQIRFMAGEETEALADLARITRVHPDYIGAWRYLEWDRLSTGDHAGFLVAARAHARLAGRPARLALLDRADQALRTGGPPALFATLLADAESRHREGAETAITVARLHAAAGMPDEAARWLDRAVALGEPYTDMLAGWPELKPLATDPAFARFFGSAAPSRPLPPAQTPSR
jgi:tetratricopeptide (TPR) repeat protein